MVPKNGVGRVWRRFNSHLNKNLLSLRCVGQGNLPHEMGLPRVEWQVLRKAQMKHGEGLWLLVLCKNGVGRV